MINSVGLDLAKMDADWRVMSVGQGEEKRRMKYLNRDGSYKVDKGGREHDGARQREGKFQ